MYFFVAATLLTTSCPSSMAFNNVLLNIPQETGEPRAPLVALMYAISIPVYCIFVPFQLALVQFRSPQVLHHNDQSSGREAGASYREAGALRATSASPTRWRWSDVRGIGADPPRTSTRVARSPVVAPHPSKRSAHMARSPDVPPPPRSMAGSAVRSTSELRKFLTTSAPRMMKKVTAPIPLSM